MLSQYRMHHLPTSRLLDLAQGHAYTCPCNACGALRGRDAHPFTPLPNLPAWDPPRASPRKRKQRREFKCEFCDGATVGRSRTCDASACRRQRTERGYRLRNIRRAQERAEREGRPLLLCVICEENPRARHPALDLVTCTESKCIIAYRERNQERNK